MATLLWSRAHLFLGVLVWDCFSSSIGVHTCDSKRRVWHIFSFYCSLFWTFDLNQVERSLTPLDMKINDENKHINWAGTGSHGEIGKKWSPFKFFYQHDLTLNQFVTKCKTNQIKSFSIFWDMTSQSLENREETLRILSTESTPKNLSPYRKIYQFWAKK